MVSLNIYTFLQTFANKFHNKYILTLFIFFIYLLLYTTFYYKCRKIVLRVDRGELRDFQKEGGKRAMDANIVDALIADFEHEDLFTHGSSGVEGLSGDAQRCMHLAGML